MAEPLRTRTLRKLPRHESWVYDAPCALTGDVTAHDLPTGLRGRRTTRVNLMLDLGVAQALQNCRQCPYRAECLERVQPARDYYDGVCGGYVWLNGQIIGGLTTAVDGVAS